MPGLQKGYEPQTKSFRTRAEAEKWARLVESEMDGGAFLSRKEAESTTLLEVVNRYECEISPQKRGATSSKPSLCSGSWPVVQASNLAKAVVG